MIFYRVDGGRVTLAEYWRLSPGFPVFFIAAFRKLCGAPFKFSFAVPRPDRLFLVEFDELPAEARRVLGREIDAAEDAGLELAFCQRLALPEPHRLGVAAHFLDPARTTSYLVLFGRHEERTELHRSCVSPLSDGSRAATTTMRMTLEPLPGTSAERCPDASCRVVLRRHREHLARLDAQGTTAVKIGDLEQFVLKCEQDYVDFHVSRGVFVPLSNEELDAIMRGG